MWGEQRWRERDCHSGQYVEGRDEASGSGIQLARGPEEGVCVFVGGRGIIALASSPSWKHCPAFECAEAPGQVTSLTSCGLLLLR